MAVSQINISDNDIYGGSQGNQNEKPTEVKQVNKNFESKQSIGMDDLMSNLTKDNKQQPAGIL